MKKMYFLLLLASSFAFANNGQPFEFNQNEPKIGDVLVINATSNVKYNHINFPQLNIVAKRGNLANYKSVHGNRVVIKEVMNNNNGNTTVLIENEDESKFFGIVKQVKANYTKSIASGEMSVANP
ncbi:hypothetical protein [Mariniflexile sp.]|uniref:hypothetical protein n=1 Tax=Mariniflexile sp. TaxID=1979402 RepID=UPI003567ED50